MAWSNTYSAHLVAASGQYFSIADASQTGLDLASNFTIACWLKYTTALNGDGFYIVHKMASVDDAYGLYLSSAASGTLGLWVSGTGDDRVSLGKAITTTINTWFHVAVVYTLATGTAEFFLNGASQGTTAGGRTSLKNSAADFLIGSAGYFGARFWAGEIDDVRIWARVLTSTEVGNLYTNLATFANGASMVGWWKFDNDTTDSSGNSNTLTANAGASATTDTPWTSNTLAEVAGVPVETISETTTVSITASEVAGVPVESLRSGYGWGGQSKSSASWSNQQKS